MKFQIARGQDFELDGQLKSPEWRKANIWELSRVGERGEELGPELNEKGNVRMLRSDDFLYVGVEMEDSDVVQQGTRDQTHLYSMGDTVELFFKPADDTYYWELYGTPNELKTKFFYPSCSYVFLPDSDKSLPEFEVKAHIDGEFNNWQTLDKGWSVEFKLPLKMFEQFGAKFRPGHSWQFLVARQNYSRRLPLKELSTVPPIREADFHLIRQYGFLEILS